MKLLFDQNLSPKLVSRLADIYPDSEHVRNVGMASALDTAVWEYARNNGFTIVSKDSDFHQRSLLLGYPPKVIWIRVGNCSTRAIAGLLREHAEDVERFEADHLASFLALA